jgi:hypothetical protein
VCIFRNCALRCESYYGNRNAEIVRIRNVPNQHLWPGFADFQTRSLSTVEQANWSFDQVGFVRLQHIKFVVTLQSYNME